MLTSHPEAAEANYRRDLGNGLILRWSMVEDIEKIAQLTGMAFRSKADDPPNVRTMNEIRELMRGDHPLMGSGDYGLVEDTSREGSPAVACTCLWRNRWDYEGIPFDVGQPEIVASDPAYRNRGLIRALFEMVHARSESEGHLVQGITGIPYFYRQFGYEYALDLDGKKRVYISQIPQVKEGEPEPFALRPAIEADLPFIKELYNLRRTRGMVSSFISDKYWLYEIRRKGNPAEERYPRIQMIVNSAGAAQGYVSVVAGRGNNGASFLVFQPFDVLPDVNLVAMMPSVLRALHRYAEETPVFKLRPDQPTEPLKRLVLSLGTTHPVYDVLGQELTAYSQPTYAWYIRVPDLPAFVRHIAPVLERRLVGSVMGSYTGELKLNFYRGGLRMVFEQGQMKAAEHWSAPMYEANDGAGFPPLVFLKLLFGYRSLDELRYMYPDVWASGETETMLKVLFPAKPSTVVPL